MGTTLSAYLPWNNWKQAFGLVLLIVLVVAVAGKTGITAKVQKSLPV